MYELIQHQEVGSGGAASIEFTSIPQIYTDLIVKVSTRSAVSNVIDGMFFTFNSTGTTYSGNILMGYSGVVNANTTTWIPNRRGGQSVGSTNTANTFSTNEYYISNYTSSSAKNISVEFASEGGESYYEMGIGAIVWDGTSAIASLKIENSSTNNFVEGSFATLYGVGRKAGIGRQPLASGGYTSFVDGYWVHTFTANGSFKPFVDLDVEYLVVAGGGGGAGGGSGGGAGGYRSSVLGESSGGGASAESTLSLATGTNYTVTIGAGGSPGTWPNDGVSGSNSVFATITSTGGGRGDHDDYGGTGGSGGGSGWQRTDRGGFGTSNQGYNGGTGAGGANPNYPGGGGGGAGGVGQNATTSVGGDGGDGVPSSITGSSVTRAGGGGGNSRYSTQGAGGAGGGTSGSLTNASSAAANTGAGGGAGGVGYTGGTGGSGIVIVRYRA